MRLNPSLLHNRAGESLANAQYSPKKLILIHEGVGMAVSLLLMVLNLLIDGHIAGMGGLSALGQQAIWSTVQAVLELAVLIFLPLWQIGLVFVACKWNRGENAAPYDLRQGLRRWGPVLRLRVLECIVFFAVAVVIGNVASILFLLTPLSDELLLALAPIMEQMQDPMQAELALTPEVMAQLMGKAMPLLIFCGVLYAVALIFVFYRIRFADYGLMAGKTALRSLIDSVRYTKKNALQVAKVDFFFWWFYLLQILCALLQSGDVLLGLAGVTLPFSADVAYFLFFIVGALAQVALMCQYNARVATTYARTYEELEQNTEKKCWTEEETADIM